MQLRNPVGALPCHRPARAACRVVVRASEDKSKVVREFREDTGEVIAAGSKQAQQADPNALYADQVTPQMSKKLGDNLSKEMKQRLRQEYYGLGGAENKTLASRPAARGAGRFVVAATRLLDDEQQATTVADATGDAAAAAAELERLMSRPASASTTSSSSSSKPAGSKWVIDESENLKSTPEHRAWTFGSMGLMAASLAGAAADVHGAGDAAVAAAAFLAAFTLSDLGTGVYHWAVDNYGDGSTPVFGRQIAAFQGHHQRPWTITQREFCNNLHQVFKPATAPAAAILAVSPWLSLPLQTFLPSFLFLVCMSQQFHAWSHMKKSELHPAVVALQDSGLLIGRKAHGAHHKPNFEGNYCIVSGWWNPLLDSTNFFRRLEDVVVATTGVEPRCWYPPETEWAEQAQP